MDENMLDLILEAREKLRDVVTETELSKSAELSEISGCNVFLKKENLQKTGAYKIRGAFNKLANLPAETKGVITASAGNHAQGLAYSARHLNFRACVVMPETAPLLKVLSTRNLGAEVILRGQNYEEASTYALELAKKEGLVYVHAFDDEFVIAGQGTIALEIMHKQALDYLLVPIGGGGLISGIASAYHKLSPKTKIIGVVAKGADAMARSFYKKCIMQGKATKTIADGIAVKDIHQRNFDIICELVSDVLIVDDEEIASAILFILERSKLVVEGAGAVCVAALLHQKYKFISNSNVGLILSGGNIDVNMLSLIIEKGLLKTQRKMQFRVTLIDRPGSLEALTTILNRVKGNIIKIDYDRTSIALEYGDANVFIALETRGQEHQNEIRGELTKAGYIFNEFY